MIEEILDKQGRRSTLDTVQQHKYRWEAHILGPGSLLCSVIEKCWAKQREEDSVWNAKWQLQLN